MNVHEYKNKIALLNQEIERLNMYLRNKAEEISNEKKKNVEWENKSTRVSQENEELKKRLTGENRRLVTEYENTIFVLNQNLQSITADLRTKALEIDQLSNQNHSLMQEIERQKTKSNDYEVTKTRDWESKVSKYNYEIEDLNR